MTELADRLEGCPFCGCELRHIETWARSFSPPRLYHEYHHDNAACVIGKRLWAFDEHPLGRAQFPAAWNTRAPATEPDLVERRGGLRLSREWCLKMAELEGDAEVGAGRLDHPLRVGISAIPSERALIIAWLRSHSQSDGQGVTYLFAAQFADDIEKGEHLRPAPEDSDGR